MEEGSQQQVEPLLLKLKGGIGAVSLGPFVPDSKPQETIDQLKNQFLPHCHKIEITECLTIKLLHCLDYCLVALDFLDEEIEALTVEVLRALRWCATDDTAALNMAMSNIVPVLDRLIVKAEELQLNEALFVKIAIQVLLNLLSGSNDKHKQTRRAKIQSDIVIGHYINLSKYCYEVSALLYNLDITDSLVVLNYILKNYSTSPNEYLDMLMGRMVQRQFVWLQYATLPSSYKLDILHFLLIEENVPAECLNCLANRFIASGNVVFQVSACTNSVIEEVALTLEILAHLSSQEKCLTHLSGNKNLLINVGVLLINAHRLGQTSDSAFKPVQKMADLQNPENLRTNPVFGFKAHLIKLIGNLCWKNRVMQDLVREAELIPVLLDCCNVDANNPFIMQWAIFAIRNLCEGNQDNQKIIAGMTRKQFVSNEVLEEFGLTLHTENGSSSTGLLFLEKPSL